jgi:membrane associated rhomboid family serine protease
MPGGRICPHCKKYTANDDARCIHCNGFLGPVWMTKVTNALTQNGLLATNLLVGLCGVVFLLEAYFMLAQPVMGERPNPLQLIGISGMSARVMLRMGALASGFDFNQPWRLLSACFLHFGLIHLVMNLVALYDFARVVEPAIKWRRMIIAYVVTGVMGFVVSTFYYHSSAYDGPYMTAGASGAVFGIQGVLLGQMRASGDPRFSSFLWKTIIYSTLFFFVIRTNQAAHLGGLGTGIILGWIFAKERRPWSRDKTMTIIALVLYAMSVASIIYAPLSFAQSITPVIERSFDDE